MSVDDAIVNLAVEFFLTIGPGEFVSRDQLNGAVRHFVDFQQVSDALVEKNGTALWVWRRESRVTGVLVLPAASIEAMKKPPPYREVYRTGFRS